MKSQNESIECLELNHSNGSFRMSILKCNPSWPFSAGNYGVIVVIQVEFEQGEEIYIFTCILGKIFLSNILFKNYSKFNLEDFYKFIFLFI